MSRPNEKPLTPHSLPADGIQGQGAKAVGPCGCDDTPTEREVLAAFIGTVHAARTLGRIYAGMTHEPPAGVVDAADCLDAAVEAIGQAVTP